MSGLWDEMLDEFRALGGTADNLCLRQGAYGRGLFACDPSKPVKVLVPESLLVDVKHVLFENDAFRVGPDAPIGPRQRSFLESYQREFSWGTARGEIEELLQMTHDAPAELRELMKTPFNSDRWLAEPTAKAIQERFLDSRVIRYKGLDVVMPILELTNHGHAARFETGNGVGLSGNFAGEILVLYQLADPLHIFNKWGFASGGEPFALSLHMGLEGKSGSLVLRRDDVRLKPDSRPFYPQVTIADDKMTLSYMMLGHKSYPKLARGNFERIMKDAGHGHAQETFDRIQHINRMQFYRLIAACEGAAPRLGRLLRDVARFQLEAMSHSVGTREV